MKKILFLIVCLSIGALSPIYAQRNAKQTKAPQITSEERAQSSIFADGLRAFYSDDYTAAEKSFRSVLAQNPQNDAAFYMLSKIRFVNSDFAGADYYIGEARKLNKHNEWYLIEMANIKDQLGDYKQSAKLWEEICKLKPDNEYYLLSLANAYLHQEKFTDVIKVYDRIEKQLGANDEISEAKKNIYLYLNDVKGAVGEYDRLIKLYPYEIKYYVYAAEIYLTNGYPEKATPYLDKALSIEKNNPLIHLSYAKYYQIKGKNDDAYRSLVIAFKNPNLVIEEKMPILRDYYATAYRSKDDKAIRRTRNLAEALIEAHPESIEAWSTLAALQMMRNALPEARVSIEKVLSLDNSNFAMWENYLMVLQQQKDYQTIINNAEEIMELFPTNSFILLTIGEAYQYLKESEKAINILNQASMFAYENAMLAKIYEVVGDAYYDLKNNTEALKAWKMSQKKGGNNQALKDKISKIENESP